MNEKFLLMIPNIWLAFFSDISNMFFKVDFSVKSYPKICLFSWNGPHVSGTVPAGCLKIITPVTRPTKALGPFHGHEMALFGWLGLRHASTCSPP